jgi:SRSO17 transposase
VFDWLVFDELYGRNEEFLAELEWRKQFYVGEVLVTTTVWTQDPATQIPEYSGRGRRPTQPVRDSVRNVKEVAEALPAASWQVLCLREGSGEPVAFEFAAVRVWAMRDQKVGPPIWLLIRRVEEDFEDGKGYLGMGHYEGRSWLGWHHHMTLVALAHLLVTGVRQRLKKKRAG